jgi:carbonic anhydrase
MTMVQTFNDKLKQMKQYAENHYETHCAIAFLPAGELRDIQSHLLSFNDKPNLMVWVIIMYYGHATNYFGELTKSWS